MIKRLQHAHAECVRDLVRCTKQLDALVARPRLAEQVLDVRRAAAQLRLVTQLTIQGTYDLDVADAWIWAAEATVERFQRLVQQG